MNPEDSKSQEPPIKNEMDPLLEERERIEGEIRNLGASTIGEFLKSKRQAKNLTLDEIDLITHIGPRWTEAIEEGTWSIYPSMLYAKGHIRGYCEALGLPSEILLHYYSKELIAAFPEEIFHPHPVLQVNQILQDSSSSERSGGSSGASRLLLWLLAALVVLVAALGSLKVWMDKTAKRHSEEKAKIPTAQKPALPQSLTPPSANTVPSQPAVQPTAPPTVATPTPQAPTQPSGSGNQNSASPVQTPASPTSFKETTPAKPASDGSKPSTPMAGETSSPQAASPNAKAQPDSFHKLKVTALKDTHVAIKEGDGRPRRYALSKGKSKVFRSKTVFWISTKDAGAVLLSLDGHALGPAGPENKSIQHKKVVLKN
jgi:cytoskeleton protein RodZ